MIQSTCTALLPYVSMATNMNDVSGKLCIDTVSQESVAYLIFYKLKKPEQIIMVSGTQYPDNLSF